VSLASSSSSGTSENHSVLGRDIFEGWRTSVKSLCEVIDNFNVEVCVHQGSALSPYLFSVVIDEVMKDIQGEITWCMMFANDKFW
jgi:hypothetical protein